MMAWVMKIFLHATEPMDSVAAFYRALRVGHIPSWLVAIIFVGTLISVIGITIYVGQENVRRNFRVRHAIARSGGFEEVDS